MTGPRAKHFLTPTNFFPRYWAANRKSVTLAAQSMQVTIEEPAPTYKKESRVSAAELDVNGTPAEGRHTIIVRGK
jgi:hypothetical protein